jgi:hypothetical protein
LLAIFFLGCYFASIQNVGSSPEYIKALTAEWKGERFAGERPKVSEAILKRLKKISVEEAWGVLHYKGFQNQFGNDWAIINPDKLPIPKEELDNNMKERNYLRLSTYQILYYEKYFTADC